MPPNVTTIPMSGQENAKYLLVRHSGEDKCVPLPDAQHAPARAGAFQTLTFWLCSTSAAWSMSAPLGG